MFNLVYDFIRNIFIGQTEIEQAEPLALLLTILAMFLLFAVMVKLIKWVFRLFSGKGSWKTRN